ncbi:uncharacterized protein LOC131330252 isoform X1 [Rhododendron vialii]|uniref:uncharacterized protein LOC131330252 isoform X1 n=1 Tax=Rhododendron vialii TaxID=182163 RepID=UPI00265FA15F|nr:uncharacterized protein LOC131330252 isoform X1 [Rhododendron vialii]XP_058219744.1 uncharacterized protein LOC131330252 isoform X1 [Rhododendron vialii]
METPMLGCGVVGPVTRSRSKAGEVLSSLVGKKRKNREEVCSDETSSNSLSSDDLQMLLHIDEEFSLGYCFTEREKSDVLLQTYSDLKKKYNDSEKSDLLLQTFSDLVKKKAKVASDQEKKKAKGVTTNSEEEVVGLTSEQRQEYSRKDFDYPEFYRGPSSDLPIHIILATEFDPDLPANFSRQIKNSAKAMDYYNSRFNSNYVEPFNPLLMTTREVGGGYLDFVVIDTHKSGRHANEMFQAILYTSPGKEPEVLMCRPEYMPPGTRKGYRPLKVGW